MLPANRKRSVTIYMLLAGVIGVVWGWMLPDRVAAGTVTVFDDIRFWVGAGEHQAALAIDWDGHDSEDSALVWGFRWNGVATSADMFESIVRADPRLYGKVGSFGNAGTAVYGIGYDANGDGEFELNDGTEFDEGGLAQSAAADLGTAVDAADWYREGWFLGYWSHGIADGTAPVWSSGFGISNRLLTDGNWDSLAYKDSTDAVLAAPSHLVAAQDSRLPGDYGRDGTIDAGDFTVWRDTLDQIPFLPGYGADGDHDGVIDFDDYDAWTLAFQNRNALTSLLVPEPAALETIAWIAWILGLRSRKKH